MCNLMNQVTIKLPNKILFKFKTRELLNLLQYNNNNRVPNTSIEILNNINNNS